MSARERARLNECYETITMMKSPIEASVTTTATIRRAYEIPTMK